MSSASASLWSRGLQPANHRLVVGLAQRVEGCLGLVTSPGLHNSLKAGNNRRVSPELVNGFLLIGVVDRTAVRGNERGNRS